MKYILRNYCSFSLKNINKGLMKQSLSEYYNLHRVIYN